MTLFSSDIGTEAKGGAVSVDMADGVLGGAPWDQRKPWDQQGLFHLSSSRFLGILVFQGTVFCLVLPMVTVALVLISASNWDAASSIRSTTVWGLIVWRMVQLLSFIRSGGFWVNEVIGVNVLEESIICEEVVWLSNVEAYGFVEVDDFVLVRDIWIGHKLSCHILVIFFEFLQPVGIHKEAGSHIPGICDCPFP